MNFEEVFEHLGHFGLYQFFFMAVVSICQAYFALQQISMNWLGPANVDHWCKIDKLANLPFRLQKEIGIPFEKTGGDQQQYSKCRMFKHNFSAYSEEELYNWNRTQRNLNVTQGCTDGWVYDKSIFLSSAIDKFDLVCDRALLVPLVSTIFLGGTLVGSVLSGFQADRFGRKITMMSSIALYVIFGILASFSPNYVAFVLFRFFASVGLASANLTGSVYIMEVIGPRWRMPSGVFYQLQFGIGFMLSAAVAFAIRDFTKVQLTLIMPAVATFIGTFTILESSRWLVVKMRTEDAIKGLEKIAVINKKKLPETLKISANSEREQEQLENVGSFSDLFRSVRVLKITFGVSFLWFVNALLYFGMALNVGALAGNLYLNLFMSGLFEIPAYLLSALTMAKIGRRWSVGFFLGFGGLLSFITIPLLPKKELGTVVTVLSSVGKASVAASYAVAIVWSNEVFPTVVRNAGLGVASGFQAVSGMMSPYVGGPFRKIWLPLPNLVFGIFGVIAAVTSVLFIPETLNMVLPETIDDIENFGKKDSKSKTNDVTSTQNASESAAFPGAGHSLKDEMAGKVFYTSSVGNAYHAEDTKL